MKSNAAKLAQSAFLALLLGAGGALAQDTGTTGTDTTGTTTTATDVDDRDDDGFPWGLLGLIGLAGLMPKKDKPLVERR